MSIGYLNSNNNNKQKTTKPNREGIGEKQSLFFFFLRRTKWWNVTFFRPLDAAHTITTYCNARKKKKKKWKATAFFPLQASLSLFFFFYWFLALLLIFSYEETLCQRFAALHSRAFFTFLSDRVISKEPHTCLQVRTICIDRKHSLADPFLLSFISSVLRNSKLFPFHVTKK